MATLALASGETGPLQHGEVLAHRRQGHRVRCGQLAGGP
jgi:hypothetical protein